MTRLLEPPIPILAIVVDGQPQQFTWEGRHYRVEQIALHWRKRVWWRGIWRDYFKLVTHNGQGSVLVVVYRDLLDNEWYLQEVYD